MSDLPGDSFRLGPDSCRAGVSVTFDNLGRRPTSSVGSGPKTSRSGATSR